MVMGKYTQQKKPVLLETDFSDYSKDILLLFVTCGSFH